MQEGNKYILTFQDDLSNYVVAMPIVQQDAENVNKTFVDMGDTHLWYSSNPKTDQSTNFISQVLKNTCRFRGIKKIQSTAVHPASQGDLERRHRVLAEYLQHNVKEVQTNWDQWVLSRLK
jgi:hypothetical protein